MFDEIASTGGGCKIYDSINYYAFNNFDYTDQITIQKFDPRDTHALVTFNTNGGDTANTQIYALKGQMVSEAIPPEKKDCEFEAGTTIKPAPVSRGTLPPTEFPVI